MTNSDFSNFDNRLDTLRLSGAQQLAIGAIRLFQKINSAHRQPLCRLTPSCSQYGIEAIARFGIFDGIKLIKTRTKRCVRPNSGYDPVPSELTFAQIKPEVGRKDIVSTAYTPVSIQQPLSIGDFEHSFKLIISYPCGREFYNQEDFKTKIADFNTYVLKVTDYGLMFKVSKVDAGEVNNFHVLKLSGTLDGQYLNVRPNEVVQLIILQLEGFFIAVRKNEFKPLYFEVDSQVIFAPPADQTIIPQEVRDRDAWVYTSTPSFWDIYWDSYVISELVELLVDIASATVDIIGNSVEPSIFDFADPVSPSILDIDPTPPGGLDIPDVGGLDLNPFDGDGCELPDFDGCDMPDLDLGGCDGCHFDDCGS